eukprot:TRINITY_DN880_c1_g1_i2.p1 TRINITY_DN880_c1_g1~~TRINITY_DN880_c1_g1_i2.p1  ORF type:complete len:932 (-),score=178.94 TRINITY_DN880_c1_g1_i2:127-2922(-)
MDIFGGTFFTGLVAAETLVPNDGMPVSIGGKSLWRATAVIGVETAPQNIDHSSRLALGLGQTQFPRRTRAEKDRRSRQASVHLEEIRHIAEDVGNGIEAICNSIPATAARNLDRTFSAHALRLELVYGAPEIVWDHESPADSHLLWKSHQSLRGLGALVMSGSEVESADVNLTVMGTGLRPCSEQVLLERISMCHNGLKSIFSPSSIAVVGASNQLCSVGGSIFTNLKAAGFAGSLYAVNKKPDPVQGEESFRTLAELATVPDLVVICTPAPTVPGLIRECGQLGVSGVIVISAGFREAGPVGQKLEAELIAAASEFPGLHFIGPNCLGVLRPANRLNASFSPVMPRPGRLTFLSQSGALCTAILDWSVEQDFGFATCVSVGNLANVSMGDLIDYFADDDQTDAVLLYLEGIDDAQHLLEAARECSRRKPILAYKAGRSAESSVAATSHTGAIATSDAVCDAMFRQAGIVRVNTIQDLFDSGKLLVGKKPLCGDRLAIVTNAGGPGVIATDAWMKAGGRLAKLSLDTLVSLDRALPSCWSHGNPIDVLGDAGVDRFQIAMQQALGDANVDAMLVIVTPQMMTEPERIGEAIVVASRQTDKPIVVSMIGGPAVQPGRKVLREAGISTYDFPEEAAEALGHLISTSRKQIRPLPEVPQFNINEPRLDLSLLPNRHQKWHRALALKQGLVDEKKSKELLADFGIPVVRTCVATTPGEAESLAEQMGYPVALKIVSPDISHKTDVGGVVLNVTSWDGVRNGYSDIMEAAAFHNPNARLEGIAVEPMVVASQGVELLLGMRRDPQFGLVLLVGAGGVTAELQNDTALEIAPFNEESVDRMLHSLRLFPLLGGYRGRPGVDLAKLRQVMIRFAKLAEEMPELVTVEINPLLVTSDGATALDARMIVDSRTALQEIPACGDKCRKCTDCANRSAARHK